MEERSSFWSQMRARQRELVEHIAVSYWLCCFGVLFLATDIWLGVLNLYFYLGFVIMFLTFVFDIWVALSYRDVVRWIIGTEASVLSMPESK